ncbi:tyrosyl-DNA phosphodiesterase 1-like isoform X1 [Pistacia vera]|uniref:tyrosyl-DNA phosphodiesterase 1-like isoform X1 n=1 Tax=Pistacia vera TaxID=55513 RepID=UPI0012635597|nr:tyrosyl-DNA phosphodiesterase 1-like isoform X1 [Pistacia vera]
MQQSSMSGIVVGHLVPLDDTLKQDTSLPKLPLSQGPNTIGRANIPLSDKRLSRKHLTLTASTDGFATLYVEGTNPVVVKSGEQRKKLTSSEHVSIANGDIIELIPGHHFFKYVTLPQKRPSSHESTKEDVNPKKMRREVEPKHEEGGNCEEAIRNFHVSSDKLPLTYQLLQVQGLPAWANTSCVSIRDVIQGDIVVAILSNYMVDIDWLLPACPTLAKIPNVLVIHGENDGTVEQRKRRKPANWIFHKPPLPIAYGTHHSKAMLLVYLQGVRIIVHTANLIYVDWNNKTQGLWMQDFPWKDLNNPSKGCGFETDLVDYLSALKWPEFSANIPALGNFKINPSFFRKFDYSSSAVRLIASVPGYHTGPNLKKWGHMKLRTVLEESIFDKEFQKSPLIYQFSSLGSLDEKWMAELKCSMSSGLSEDKRPLGIGEPLIIWPTVEDVRCSLEGYAAGNAIPSPHKNVDKEFLKKYWAKWKANHTGRCRAMPHIKTFLRYNGQKLAWFLLSSANLSKAAWGTLQKNNSQLMVRSYELGVLFLPSGTKHGCRFSCTNNGGSSKSESGTIENTMSLKTKLVTLTWQGSRNTDEFSEIITLPVPYELPPQRYSSEDVPWSWDRRYSKKDVYGQVWPRQVQLYACQDS